VIAPALLLVTLIGTYLAISAQLALSLTRAHRVSLDLTPESYGLMYEPVRFPSRVDTLQLEGWLLQPTAGSMSQRPVIIVHDKGTDRVHGVHGQLLPLAAELVHSGFPVLAFDLRGSGQSAGSFFTLGAHEVRDVGGAIDFLAERGLADSGVNLLGYSMGAATTLLAAGDEPLVSAVAIDSGYADLNSVLDFHLAQRALGLRFFKPGALLMSRILLGIDAYAIRPVDAVPALAGRGLPLLAIHGEADTVVPFEHGRRLAAAYGPQVESYFVSEADHLRAYEADPDAYVSQVVGFFSRHT
jgi:pimeloyl-ACP methyl ester carboxylesterase